MSPSQPKTRSHRAHGFTLLEMLLVVTIIGLLAALMVPKMGKQLGKSQRRITVAQLEMVAAAVEQFRLDVNRYPSELEGLGGLVKAPQGAAQWDGPYLGRRSLPKDGWNREFVYLRDDEFGFRIVSYGADGSAGGDGEDTDIDNRS